MSEFENTEKHEEKPLSADAHLPDWPSYSRAQRLEVFARLPRTEAEELFLSLGPTDQAELLNEITALEKRSWVRLLAPDDVVDLIQALAVEERDSILALLDEVTRRECIALLAYSEDDAGGLMNPQFVRLRPNMAVDEAILYLRAQTRTHAETTYYAYVLDSHQKLLGVVSFRELFSAPPDQKVSDFMQRDVVSIPEDMDQEDVSRIFAQQEYLALPVVDQESRMKGVITVDDIVQVVEEEATEDIQKFGAVEALEAPYFQTSFFTMIRKRAGWLTILFFGEMFTATAMGFFQHEIEKAVVLALFIPLIISSGGNSGSQASTLVIRAMALGEIRIMDWFRVFSRELLSGLALGLILGLIGFLRINFWPNSSSLYGDHYTLIGLTVAFSLVGVVLWGTITGSMLPFVLKRVGLDPATASAPFVATLVDITGLVIYFSLAKLFLQGKVIGLTMLSGA